MKKFLFSQAVKNGDYLADYFKKTTAIIAKYKPEQKITMQFFQRENDAVLAGIDQVISLIELGAKNYQNLKIEYLDDGSIIQPLEPVLKITGPYQDFGYLEGMIDGILARNTSIATNSRNVIALVGPERALNMNDRADIYYNQEIDGYASYIGGFRNFVSQAALKYLDDKSVPIPTGTMPHALIQSFNGDLLAATKAFYEMYPENKLVALVDYHNDCVNDALLVANYFKEKLYAVRLDTSSSLTDKTLEQNRTNYPQDATLNGVSKYLVQAVRNALDEAGYQHVKIIVSSGFGVKKIAEFEAEKVPVDIYGIGEALAKVNINFTGDAVEIDGQKQAKFGREVIENTKLKELNWNEFK